MSRTIGVIVAFAIYLILIGTFIAAVIRYDIAIELKVIILICFIWGCIIYYRFELIQEALRTIQFWTRVNFITNHIRNEKDDLEDAMDRYARDFRSENADKYLRTVWDDIMGNTIANLIFFGIIGGIVFVILRYDILGLLGSLSEILRPQE